MASPVGRRQGYNCNLGTRDFSWQAQLKGERATNAIWELEIFGGRPSWKATRLQLQFGNSRFLVAAPVGRRQGYNCNLGTRDFSWQAQLKGERATNAIWELEIFGGRPSWKATRLQLQFGNSRFLVAAPVGRRQGYNCNLGTRDFLGAGTVKRRTGYKCNLGIRDFWVAGPVGRRQGYNCNVGTRDFLVAGPVKRRKGYKCNLGTRDFWGQA